VRNKPSKLERYIIPTSRGFMIVGLILLIIGIGILIYVRDTIIVDLNSGAYIVSLGSGLFAIGLALRSIKESRKTDRQLKASTNSNFLRLVDFFEKERLHFLETRPITQYHVEVLVWKSLDYLKQAVTQATSFGEWIEPQNLERLVRYFSILVKILIQDSKTGNLWKIVRNIEVSNIISMYISLWESGIINKVKSSLKDELLAYFDSYICPRKMGGDDVKHFKLVKKALNSKKKFNTFEKIEFEKLPNE